MRNQHPVRSLLVVLTTLVVAGTALTSCSDGSGSSQGSGSGSGSGTSIDITIKGGKVTPTASG